MNTAIENLHKLYMLKEVERRTKVNDRHESTAEHTYSAMVLAAYFLPKITPPLDAARVYKLILMHDWIEVHAGDTFLFDESRVKDQHRREALAAEKLAQELPAELGFRELHHEFESRETREAKFARAVDILDPMVHSMYRKEDWTGNNFDEGRLRAKKLPELEAFPVLVAFFEELMAWMRDREYFGKNE